MGIRGIVRPADWRPDTNAPVIFDDLQEQKSMNPFKHLSTEFWATSGQYIGTKELDAIPMTRGEYNQVRGWDIPDDENPDDGGYIVRYSDGYVSWSPESQFDKAYCQNWCYNFGDALYFLKAGQKLARAGWNGKGMWIILIRGGQPSMRPGSAYAEALGEYAASDGIVDQIAIDSHIDMFTAGQTMQPGWLASQADMLAEDWGIV
jgi:hypothetical protein